MKTYIKLAFALIFAALLDQPAFALLPVSAGDGCSIYLPSQPKAGGQYKWTGQCVEGVAVGDGVLQFLWKGAPYSESSGTAIRGVRTGRWVLTEFNKTYEYALVMKDGVADSIAVRAFPKGERAKAFSRAETIIKVIEKNAEKSNSPGLPVVNAAETIIKSPEHPPNRTPLMGKTKINAGGSQGRASMTCGGSISWSATEEQEYPYSTKMYEWTYELVAGTPVRISRSLGTDAPSISSIEDVMEFTKRALRLDQENSFCNRIRFCHEDKAGQEKTLAWLNCIAANSAASQTAMPAPSDDIDIVTPSLPGCPQYLRKSLVAWTRKPGSNPQLNVWQVKNVSNRILNVTYRVDGANTDTGTLNPGDVAEAWQLLEQPPYVVRDFQEVFEFNAKAGPKRSLQCSLAIRPR